MRGIKNLIADLLLWFKYGYPNSSWRYVGEKKILITDISTFIGFSLKNLTLLKNRIVRVVSLGTLKKIFILPNLQLED